MKCKLCEADTTVIDSRPLDGGQIRRRRECKQCRDRFTTLEVRARLQRSDTGAAHYDLDYDVTPPWKRSDVYVDDTFVCSLPTSQARAAADAIDEAACHGLDVAVYDSEV